MRKKALFAKVAIATMAVVAATSGVSHAQSTPKATHGQSGWMDGSEVVPGPGHPSGRLAYILVLETAPQRLCHVLSPSQNIGQATSAALHRGAPGTNGPIELTLKTPTSPGQVSGCFNPVPTETPETDPTTLTFDEYNDLLAHPTDYYIVVNTVDYPQGAVRKQLRQFDS